MCEQALLILCVTKWCHLYKF